jgi:hypothetical protein
MDFGLLPFCYSIGQKAEKRVHIQLPSNHANHRKIDATEFMTYNDKSEVNYNINILLFG